MDCSDNDYSYHQHNNKGKIGYSATSVRVDRFNPDPARTPAVAVASSPKAVVATGANSSNVAKSTVVKKAASSIPIAFTLIGMKRCLLNAIIDAKDGYVLLAAW